MGNVLYLALQADRERRAGRDVRVLDPDPGNDWSAAFPEILQILLPADELRLTDRRVDLTRSFYQGFGSDFTGLELADFVRRVLVETASWSPHVPAPVDGAISESVTVNVRRGDYYANPHVESRFGFDITSYVRRAIAAIEGESGAIHTVVVVSDGVDWCRDHLGWLSDHADVLRFEGPENGVLGNFRSIASARRLVITNSTFSYWGAYVSNVIHGDNYNQVWVPNLHSWDVNGGRPWQHDPGWRAIDVVPSTSPRVARPPGSRHE